MDLTYLLSQRVDGSRSPYSLYFRTGGLTNFDYDPSCLLSTPCRASPHARWATALGHKVRNAVRERLSPAFQYSRERDLSTPCNRSESTVTLPAGFRGRSPYHDFHGPRFTATFSVIEPPMGVYRRVSSSRLMTACSIRMESTILDRCPPVGSAPLRRRRESCISPH